MPDKLDEKFSYEFYLLPQSGARSQPRLSQGDVCFLSWRLKFGDQKTWHMSVSITRSSRRIPVTVMFFDSVALYRLSSHIMKRASTYWK